MAAMDSNRPSATLPRFALPPRCRTGAHNRAALPCGLAAVCLVCFGCTHLGPRLEQTVPHPGAPTLAEVLADLAANDRQLNSFRATGAFTLVSPERPGADRFGQSTVTFRRPGDLNVVGRKLALPKPLFRLTCVGNEYLIEFPTEKQYYHELEGAEFESVPFPVSPSDVVREMFFPEDWEKLTPRHVRMVRYDDGTRTAAIEVLESILRKRVRRRVEVTGTPWVVTKSELLDKQGDIVAVTQKSDYRDIEGLRFPAMVDAEFPGEKTRMSFNLRSVTLNPQINPGDFNIDALKQRLESLGHEAVEYDHEQQP